uniref:Methyltransferase FkbM domain-containing protein n=1 Tax=viral metagenome TaxID=1070528 RepID=A0A6C0DKB6_9ZZZZ
MEKLGTEYGGWYVPNDIKLNENSIIYSGGVGEDVSFDLSISTKYNSNIFLIDPTEKSKKHYNEVINFYKNKHDFTGNIQTDYYEKISNLQPNIEKIFYLDIGLWNKPDTLKFFKQDNQNYVSQSLIDGMFGVNYDIVNVDTIKNIMVKLNHHHIDLLKLDIEGAEINVLEQMFNDNIYPKYLCIEFDLLLKNKDYDGITQRLIQKMINEYDYKILIDDGLNITFERK